MKEETGIYGPPMSKAGSENLILTGQFGKEERGKQSITYLSSLIEWIVNQNLRDSTKTKFTKSCQEEEIVEIHDRQRPKGTEHMEEKRIEIERVQNRNAYFQTELKTFEIRTVSISVFVIRSQHFS